MIVDRSGTYENCQCDQVDDRKSSSQLLALDRQHYLVATTEENVP
jgi:hypothetical protein